MSLSVNDGCSASKVRITASPLASDCTKSGSAFEDNREPRPDTDADRDDRNTRPATIEFAGGMADDPPAGRAERMPDCERTPVNIELVRVELAPALEAGECLRRERLVEFDHIDIRPGAPGSCERLVRVITLGSMSVQRALRLSAFLTVLLTAGYSAVVALTPLPELKPDMTVDARSEISVDGAVAASILAEEALPTGFAWEGASDVWVTHDGTFPLASITKLVVALVGQESRPISPEEKPYTWDWDDLAMQAELLAEDSVIMPIQLGTELTRLELLRGALIPSANDFMRAYTSATFGSHDCFLSAVATWRDKHGLTSLEIVEPTGLDERNAASLRDILEIGRLALADPVIAEIVRQTDTTIPGVGTVETTNPLLPVDPRVVGLKTGTLYSSGYNLLFAATMGHERRVVAVTLGRESSEHRANDSASLLDRIATLPTVVEFPESSTLVGTVTTWDGDVVELVSDPTPPVELVPGESATREIDLGVFVNPGEDGSIVGTVTVTSPHGTDTREVTTSATIETPGFWWKFRHPQALFARD